MRKLFLLFVSALTFVLIVSINGTYAGSQRSDKSALSGKVVETMTSGGYTYVNIVKDDMEAWVAVPPTKIEVGEEITFKHGSIQNNFRSESLNRTFEIIVFSSGVIEKIEVEKASGSDAYTVAELYKKKDELNEKKVVIRGKVVKFSPNIMDKNWIHLQDGSGKVSKRTNDIMVTSQDTTSVGDIVTLKGTLSMDKDFGKGYKYKVIVEEARIQE